MKWSLFNRQRGAEQAILDPQLRAATTEALRTNAELLSKLGVLGLLDEVKQSAWHKGDITSVELHPGNNPDSGYAATIYGLQYDYSGLAVKQTKDTRLAVVRRANLSTDERNEHPYHQPVDEYRVPVYRSKRTRTMDGVFVGIRTSLDPTTHDSPQNELFAYSVRGGNSRSFRHLSQEASTETRMETKTLLTTPLDQQLSIDGIAAVSEQVRSALNRDAAERQWYDRLPDKVAQTQHRLMQNLLATLNLV